MIVNFKVIDSVIYKNDCTKGEFIHTYTQYVPDIVGFSLKQTYKANIKLKYICE